VDRNSQTGWTRKSLLRAAAFAIGLLTVVLIAHAPILKDLIHFLRLPELSSAATDTATHYLRVRDARDLYLPSGHRLGWDPYWFQGYVPFLLYPHLTYVLLALCSMAVPVDLARLFNAYAVVTYFALPILVAVAVRRSIGWSAALVVAAWLSVLSTFGAGLKGVFVIGLLSQQVGTLVFAALAHDLIIARRIDRAAIWLGLIPLIHVHTALIAAVAWLGAGLLALVDGNGRRKELAGWFMSSVIALLIASPTLLTAVQGWGQVGSSTSFGALDDPIWRLVSGTLVAPWPTLLAIILCIGIAVFRTPGTERKRFAVWCGVGSLLVAVSVHKWTIDVPAIDRVMVSMIYLRTLPFAFVWTALLGVAMWNRLPSLARGVVVAFTVAGIVGAWPMQKAPAERIRSTWEEDWSAKDLSVEDYRSALDWVASDVDDQVTTLAISAPRPHARALVAAIELLRLPLIGGHGAELASVHNGRLVENVVDLPCENLRRQTRDYAVGYMVGVDGEDARHVEECLGNPPAAQYGDWWVFATGYRWGTIAGGAISFVKNETWTELSWRFQKRPSPARVRLPVANSAPWTAEVDGTPVAISSTADRMMTVTIPAGAKQLKLRYDGYAGEWASVALALTALMYAGFRSYRHTLPELASRGDSG